MRNFIFKKIFIVYIYNFKSSSMEKFSLIVAVDDENGIGKNGDLSWDIPEDMKYFKKITTTTKSAKKQNAVIMWRTTWESIPKKYRPLPKRYNCILSRSYIDGTRNSEWWYEFSSLDATLKHLEQQENIENIFIIWWAQLYNKVLRDHRLTKAYITRVYQKYHCDVFFNGLPLDFKLSSRSEMKQYKWLEFEFSIYKRKFSLKRFLKNLFSRNS